MNAKNRYTYVLKSLDRNENLISGFDLLPCVIFVKILLSNLVPAVSTEANTEAAEEAEITALVTHQVLIVKKVVVMIQEVMNPALEVILPLQEMNITVAGVYPVAVAVRREVVRLLLPTQDMQAKSVKII